MRPASRRARARRARARRRPRGATPTSAAAATAGRSPASSPAITVTSAVRPSASVSTWRGMSWSHSIVKCGSTILSRGRQVDPDLEQLGGVRAVTVEEREHLGVLDAAAGGHPLHVAAAVAGGGAERVGVVDEALADERDRLEAAVRVDGEARERCCRGTCASRRWARSRCRSSGPSSEATGPRSALPAG